VRFRTYGAPPPPPLPLPLLVHYCIPRRDSALTRSARRAELFALANELARKFPNIGASSARKKFGKYARARARREELELTHLAVARRRGRNNPVGDGKSIGN